MHHLLNLQNGQPNDLNIHIIHMAKGVKDFHNICGTNVSLIAESVLDFFNEVLKHGALKKFMAKSVEVATVVVQADLESPS